MKSNAFITRLLLVIFALFLAGCGGGDDEPFTPRDIPFTRVNDIFNSYWPVGTYVIKTESEWRTAWDQHTPFLVMPERPTIDFSTSMLVGVSHEPLKVGCTGFVVSRVVEEAVEVRVEYQYLYPTPNSSCTERWGSDFDLVQIAVTRKPITFVRTGAMEPPPGIK